MCHDLSIRLSVYQGASLKPPRKQWNLVQAKAPTPRILWSLRSRNSLVLRSNAKVVVVTDSGVEAIHGRYVCTGKRLVFCTSCAPSEVAHNTCYSPFIDLLVCL